LANEDSSNNDDDWTTKTKDDEKNAERTGGAHLEMNQLFGGSTPERSPLAFPRTPNLSSSGSHLTTA
jgi:hypothetical protein